MAQSVAQYGAEVNDWQSQGVRTPASDFKAALCNFFKLINHLYRSVRHLNESLPGEWKLSRLPPLSVDRIPGLQYLGVCPSTLRLTKSWIWREAGSCYILEKFGLFLPRWTWLLSYLRVILISWELHIWHFIRLDSIGFNTTQEKKRNKKYPNQHAVGGKVCQCAGLY